MLLASEAHVLQQIVFSPNQDSQNATQIVLGSPSNRQARSYFSSHTTYNDK